MATNTANINLPDAWTAVSVSGTPNVMVEFESGSPVEVAVSSTGAPTEAFRGHRGPVVSFSGLVAGDVVYARGRGGKATAIVTSG